MAKAPKKKSSTGSVKPVKSVVSALPAKRQKGTRGPMKQELVDRYSAELSKTLGTSAFNGVFERLKADQNLKQEEAVALASTILDASIPTSTARGTALGRITKLHSSLFTFRLKQKAIGGRSAA